MNTPVKLYSWHISIESINGDIRDIPLSHEYPDEVSAQSEAETIADHEYLQSDIGWSLHMDTPFYRRMQFLAKRIESIYYGNTELNVLMALENIRTRGIPL